MGGRVPVGRWRGMLHACPARHPVQQLPAELRGGRTCVMRTMMLMASEDTSLQGWHMREMSCGSAASHVCMGTFLARLAMMPLMDCGVGWGRGGKKSVQRERRFRGGGEHRVHRVEETGGAAEQRHGSSVELPFHKPRAAVAGQRWAAPAAPRTCVACATACFSSLRALCALLARNAWTMAGSSSSSRRGRTEHAG